MSIKLSHINKTFGGQKVLDEIDLTFREHETTVIVGPSGSGKSTLLRCMNLLELPEQGELHIAGETLLLSGKLAKKEVLNFRRKTGMVFQGFHLFPHLTVLENIMEGPVHVLGVDRKLAEKEGIKLLERVGLIDKIHEYPSRLSGGQQQRVAIARSLAMSPYFLLFDEPTSALDPELEEEVLKVIAALASERQSMIIVTHNMFFARKIAQRIIFLEKGQVFYDGDPKGFFQSQEERIQKFISAMTFQTLEETEKIK